MITLDQVYLLEQKVESAVAKIQQLQAENAALNKKVEELTNALSSKSEQLNTFESDQNQIEDGIRKALDRLSLIENSVLKAVGQVAPVTVPPVTKPVTPTPQPVQARSVVIEQPKPVVETVQPVINSVPSFDDMETVPTEEPEYSEASESEKQLEETLNFTEEEVIEEPVESFSFEDSPADMMDTPNEPEEDSSDELGFDIF